MSGCEEAPKQCAKISDAAKAEVDRLLKLDVAKRAVDLTWNNKFDDAEKELAATCTTIPRHADHFTEIQLIKCILTGTAAECQKLEDRVKAQRTLSENHMKLYAKKQIPPGFDINVDGRDRQVVIFNLDIDSRISNGEAMMMNAVMHFVGGSKVKAILQLRKSWKTFQGLEKDFTALEPAMHPEIRNSLHFGLGFFYFVVSIIPGSFLRIAQVAGFKADGPRGLELCREVREQSELRMPFATILLLFHLLIVPRGLSDIRPLVAQADVVLGETLKRYPEGVAWHIMASQSYRKQAKLEEGRDHARTALEGARAIGAEPATLAYEYAACHFMMIKWDEAIKALEPLAHINTFRLRGTAGLQAASAYLMNGQADKARQLWKDLPTLIGKTHSATDASVMRWAARYLQNGGHFAAFDVLYIRRDLAKMVGLMDQLLVLLDKQAKAAGILKDDGTLVDAATSTRKLVDKSEAEASGSTIAPKNPLKTISGLFKKKNEQQQVEVFVWTNDYRAEYLLMKAALLKTKNGLDDEQAISLLEQIPLMEKVLIDKWYLPYAWFELCESYYNRKKYHETAQALKKCMSYDDYPWEDPLRVRARVTADHLKKALSDAHIKEDVATDDAEDVKESSAATTTTTSSAASDDGSEEEEKKEEEKKEEKKEEEKKEEKKEEEKKEEKKEEEKKEEEK